MSTTSRHPEALPRAAPDPAQEVLRLAALLEARRAELSSLQQELRDFKARYASTVGSRLAELAELESALREAEARTLGVEHAEAEEDDVGGEARPQRAVKSSLKSLFWSVAKLFHPDHAADESEARRRHAVMAEASRAYRDGDVESLGALLEDAELRLYCATPRATEDGDAEIDLAARVVSLKEELLTVEFGIKRVRQDRLYRLMLEASEAAASGRDALAEEAARLERKLAKTRNRLAHLS